MIPMRKEELLGFFFPSFTNKVFIFKQELSLSMTESGGKNWQESLSISEIPKLLSSM